MKERATLHISRTSASFMKISYKNLSLFKFLLSFLLAPPSWLRYLKSDANADTKHHTRVFVLSPIYRHSCDGIIKSFVCDYFWVNDRNFFESFKKFLYFLAHKKGSFLIRSWCKMLWQQTSKRTKKKKRHQKSINKYFLSLILTLESPIEIFIIVSN
jgi:hypothetical protein